MKLQRNSTNLNLNNTFELNRGRMQLNPLNYVT